MPAVNDQMVSQIDFLNSIASLIGSEIRSKDGEDLANVFFKNEGRGRNQLILEAQTKTAFRKGDWVLIPPYPGPEKSINVNIESGNAGNYQLYNLEQDISQQNNLAENNPEMLKEMIESYELIRNGE